MEAQDPFSGLGFPADVETICRLIVVEATNLRELDEYHSELNPCHILPELTVLPGCAKHWGAQDLASRSSEATLLRMYLIKMYGAPLSLLGEVLQSKALGTGMGVFDLEILLAMRSSQQPLLTLNGSNH